MFCSIIVPIYNVEEYVEKCIISLLKQDIDDYEIILIDDKSTDGSLQIAEKYANESEKIRLIKKEHNSGLSDTRNTGLKVAKGDYIFFVDSDDYLKTNILGTVKEEVIESDADIAYMGFVCEDGKIETIQYTYVSEPGTYSVEEFMLNELRHGNLSIPSCMACYRRRLIIDNGFFFETGILHEDVRWSPIVLLAADRVLATKTVDYHYLIRSSSISHQKKDRSKNGRDLMNTCVFLKNYSESISRSELRKYFLNYVATAYLKAVAVNDVAFNDAKSIDRFFPVEYAYRPKDKLRSLLFAISPKVYSKVYVFIKEKIQKQGI